MEITAPLGSYLTPSFDHATVGDAMRPRVMTCAPETPMVTVAQLMATEHVHAIVLLSEDEDGRHPSAIVTDRDVLCYSRQLDELTAAEAAGGDLLVGHPDEPLAAAAGRMAAHGATHMLVVDPLTDCPVGVLSTLDVAGILAWGRG